MKAKAIRMTRTGGPEVLEYVDVDVGEPGPGEARVRQHAIGLNFIDVYFRTGLYPMPLPSGIGLEAAGVVEAIARASSSGMPQPTAWRTASASVSGADCTGPEQARPSQSMNSDHPTTTHGMIPRRGAQPKRHF